MPYRNKQVHILLKKRRYRCECGKRFFEKYSFLPKYHHLTQRVYENILREFKKPVTFKQVAERYGVSVNTVVRICDLLRYKLYKLPEVIAIEESKGSNMAIEIIQGLEIESCIYVKKISLVKRIN